MANIGNMILERLNGGAPTLSPAASLYAKDKDEEEKKKNRGGILGGLGYVGEKLGLGLLQGIEGVWDYAAGGIADLFGADAWAERQFSSDWLNYNHADDWYNPGEGWKVAGDVTGGIGTSVPAIVAAGLVTYATGGAALPIVGTALPGIVGIGVGSLSAAGTSTKEAMQESGELTAKEYLYGAGMGAVEAVTEKLSGGLGAGVTKAAKSVGKAFGKVAAKETAEAAAKSAAKKGVALSLKTAAKSAGKEFASEAFEEGFSEWVAPYIARATYDPNAQRATGEEILYSAFIGGLSGVGTAGGVGAFVQHKNVKSGTVIADEGRAKQILDLAKQYMEDGFSNTEDAQGIREIYEKLAPAVERGEALNKEQRRMLGELNSFEVEEQLRPTLQRSALTAVNGADAIAERLNADGRYKMVDDKFTYVDSEKSIPEGATVREITAEDITKGYDPSKKDSIREAIQKNDVLRYIAASDAAGRFIMTAKDFEKAALSGQKIQSQADLNLFIENASAEQKAAVGKELGVTDWNTLNIEGFNERAAAYRESGKAEAYKQKTAKIEKMKQLADSKPKSIPRAIALADGDVKHYADADSNIAIARTGDTFLVYDYKTGNVTRDMTRAEVNAELARYRQSKSATTETTNATSETANATSEKTSENFSSDAKIEIKDEKISKTAFENEFSEEKSRPTVKEIKAANEAKEQAKRFDALAKEKIKDYDGLSEANKSMIRKIFREAEANGISEADALSYARVSARTGLDITFDKKACYKGKNEAGEDVYHAGFYDPENNRIVVNPETKKKHTVLLIHELSHAMRSYRKNGEVKYFIDADAKVSEKMWKEIRKYYADENGKVDASLALDEASAYYAEALFGTEGAIDLLLGEKPTLKQKILSFFAKSAEYYSTDEKLSKEARRHFRKFKAMFDAFTARNYGRNAETGLAGDKSARRFAAENAQKITADMTDEQRYAILKNKKITAPFYRGEADFLISEKNKDLESKEKDFAKKAIVEIAEKLGITRKEINFKDVEVKILISKSNLKESITKEATPEQIAKLLPVLVPTAENSIAIERHDNRYYFDTDTVYFDNLLGAYVDGDNLVPVRFGLKHSITGATTLYVVVDQNKVALKNLGETKNDRDHKDATPDLTGESSLLNSVTYSISQIIPFVNSKDLLRYLPDGMLDEKQLGLKWGAVAETIKYTNKRNDKKFAEYISKGDMRSVKQMVASAAKAAGYTDKVYHGTKAFGFTEFDTEKTDDKRSLFAAGSTELAQTYSGKHGIKKLSDIKNIDGLSNEEVAEMLNKEASESYEGAELKTEYEIFTLKDVNNLITEVNDGIDGLQKVIDVKVKEYADKMAIDFNDTDAKTHSRLIEANELLKSYEYKRLSTPLYVLLHYTDAFRGDSNEKDIADLEYKIRLMNKLSDADTANGVIVKKDLDGYGVSILSFDKAREELKDLISSGNYALYGKPGKQLVIDAKGQNWNNIKNWIQSAYHSTQDTYVKKDDNYYRLYDSNTDKQIFHGRIEINDKNDKMSIDAIHPIMVQKANNNLYIRSENMRTTRDIAKFAKDEGFDSVKFENLVDNGGNGESIGASDVYVYFNPMDLKSADPVTYDDNGNVIPISERFNPKKSDIRFSMEEIDPAKMGDPTLPRTAGTMSVGQYKKRIADLTKAKSYSKDQIYDIVKKLPMADMAMEKTREQVAEAVWQIYNEQLTASERREAAHDIAQFLTARLMSEAKTENPDAAEANEAMAYLRTGIGRLAFSEADRAEILHNLDKDGWRRILGRWGFKGKRNPDGTLQGVRTPMEVFVTDIAREMPGMEHLEQMHPVEAFLEIDSYYLRVKEEAAKKKTSAFLYMSDEDINSLAKSIEDIIVEAYNQGGGKSIFIKRIEQGISYYEQRAAKYKEEFNEIRGRDKIHGLLMDQTQKLKDLKLRRFANITDGANETFKNIISELARLQYRGNLSVTNAKKAVKDLYVWYTSKEVKENLFGFTSEDPGLWQQGVAEMLEELSAVENKNFSKVELYALLDVLTYFTHFVQNFGKVWHHGEWVDAKELATNFIQVAQNQSKVKHHLVRDLLRKYLNTFGDPAAVVRMMDQYQDGFFTQIYDDLRDAAISASYAERDILSAYDDFLKSNKRYVENASKETVSYRGVDVPKMHMIGLYMTMKRKHAQAGYAINGFSFKDANGDTVRVRGSLDPDAVYTKQEIEDYIARERKKIENLLSDTDKQYISILEKVYNEDAKRLKSDRDIQRFGMTNATNDYYYPIRRANAAQKLDADMQMEIDRVSSASFNKDTVAGAKQELFIESADSLFLRHVHVVCQYAYLTPVLDMQKMLYNLDISGNKNHPVSIHTETQNIWPEGFKYFREMVSDVQGIPRSSSIGSMFLSSLRSNYAKFQLGANPKTWITQFSSLFASTSLLDASSVIKGLGMSSVGFEQYSKLAKIRVEDNAAAKAQGVLDNKVKRTADTIGDTLMAPIGMVDKFVVGRLFCACQVQIEKNGGAKIGMEENRIEAGKLLTRVILETQQNSLATERSAAMRSGNEFYRALTMFRSDSMKVIGRVIDGFGEVSALKGILKNKEMDADSRKELESRLKKAKKKTAKASTSLILSAVFMAMIAQGFRWLYAKDKEEDETFVGTLTRDTLANMLGGLPGFADAYSKIVEGYDVGNYSYSAINDVLDSAKGLFDIAEGIMTGEGTSQERMRGIRNASYSLGQLLGIPTRNVYNLLYGLTKRISPRAGYKIDSAFYEKNFKTDLEKALEKGDDRMATLAMQLLLGERIGEEVNEAVFNELFELSKQGYKVLPRVTPDSISINGNVYEFTEDERSEVGRIYEEREQGLKKLFASSAYKSLSGEEKEKAVSTVYDLYYDKALSEALGVDRGNKLLFASAMGFDKYAVFKLKTSAIEPDTDRRGEKIEGSKRKNTIAAINKLNATREEKLLMIVASGYALKDGDIRGISAANAKRMLLKYILSMKGTQAEKAALAEACGFEVKNGKILKNSL